MRATTERYLVLLLEVTVVSEMVTLPSKSSHKKREKATLGLYREEFRKLPNTAWHLAIQSDAWLSSGGTILVLV